MFNPPLCERLSNRWRCSPREVPMVILGALFGLVGWAGAFGIVWFAAAPEVPPVDPGRVLPALLFFV